MYNCILIDQFMTPPSGNIVQINETNINIEMIRIERNSSFTVNIF